MSLFRFRQPQPALGVDISTDAIRAVQLIPNNDSYDIGCATEIEVPANIMAEDEITDIGQLGKVMQQLRRHCHAQIKDAVTAVAGTQVISKIIMVERELDDNAITDQIELESESLIPFPLNEVSYDFESLGVNPSNENQERILVTAARTESINARVEALKQAGFTTRVVDVESQALVRCCQHVLPHQHPHLVAHEKPLLLLDIAESNMLLLVVSGEEILFSRHHTTGVNNLLKALADKQTPAHVIFEQLQANETENFSELMLQDFLGTLWQQLSRSLQLYSSSGGAPADFSGLALTGCGAELPCIQRFLQDQVEYPVASVDPFALFSLAEPLKHLRTHGPRFAQATGLALRSQSLWHT